MRRICLTALLCALIPLPAWAGGAHSETISVQNEGVPICTVVAVQTVDEVDSGTAKAGDFFRFQTVNAVTAGNRIVIPARTMGWGLVAIASPAGRGGRAGTLVLEPRYLLLPDGRKLGVVLDHSASALEKNGLSNNLPGYLGAIPVPGVGVAIGAFNYFHHGKDITVPKGTMFAVFGSDDPGTQRCQGER
ncbi:MAG: hypothetical protein M3N19_02445 [Candidatus Eremiobacteraeota bacterium]|nr:hypothetical protein [Candidatus Eremiobacteraeota bacterium]